MANCLTKIYGTRHGDQVTNDIVTPKLGLNCVRAHSSRHWKISEYTVYEVLVNKTYGNMIQDDRLKV